MVGDTRQGWAIFAAFSVMFLIGVFVCYRFEQAGNPDSGESGGANARDARPARRQHGGQRGPLRHRQLGAVGHGDHRRQLRRGQQHARQLHADRRTGAAVQHHDRRSHLRRRRRRPVRHAALLHSRRVHRRPDGGPHAGIPGQEDRTEGSQDGDAGGDRHRVQHSGLHRAQLGDPVSRRKATGIRRAPPRPT